MRLDLGESVSCSDGAFGTLSDVIVEPQAKRVTHLVIQPHGGDGVSRLVPIDLAQATEGDGGLTLSCEIEATTQLDSVQDYVYQRFDAPPPDDPDKDVGIERVLTMPYSGGGLVQYDGGDASYGVIYDRIPRNEVELRRASSILAADGGFLGEIDAFIIAGDQITHVVLDKGHLWGRRKTTIPIDAVAKVETDKITVDLSKEAVGALPSVRVHRWF